MTKHAYRVGQSAPIPTLIEFLLDESGSMHYHLSPTIGGFKEFLTEQKSLPGECLLTLTKFNSDRHHTPYVDLEIGMVPDLTVTTFLPNGGTPLRDAMVSRLDALKSRLASWPTQPRVMFAVMTDGADTNSRFGVSQTRQAVLDAIGQEWTCLYLGATSNACSIADELGFARGNVKSFATAKMRETFAELAAGTRAFRASTQSTASNNFFADSSSI